MKEAQYCTDPFRRGMSITENLALCLLILHTQPESLSLDTLIHEHDLPAEI